MNDEYLTYLHEASEDEQDQVFKGLGVLLNNQRKLANKTARTSAIEYFIDKGYTKDQAEELALAMEVDNG